MKIASNPKNFIGRSNGFSLIELMIVVVIIGIIAAIAVPLLIANTRKSHEGSAIASLKLMLNGEAEQRTRGNYGSLQQLQDSRFIDESFTDGDSNDATMKKSGYNFLLTIAPDGNNFVISAIPNSSSGVTKTGNYRFGVDSNGVIFKDSENLDTHFTDSNSLHTSTSTPIDE